MVQTATKEGASAAARRPRRCHLLTGLEGGGWVPEEGRARALLVQQFERIHADEVASGATVLLARDLDRDLVPTRGKAGR